MRARIVLRLSSLGDLVLCSAFVRSLHREHPDDKIFFWVSEKLAPLVRGFGVPVEIVPFASGPLSLFRALRQGFRFRRQLDESGIRLTDVYDLHGVGKSWAFRLGLLWGAPLRDLRLHVTEKRSLLRNLSVLFRRDLLGARFVYREHLKLLGSEIPEERPRLEVGPVARRPRSLLVAPDASQWKKRWPVGYWADFLRQILLDPRNFEVTLVGPAQSLPTDLIDELESVGGSRVRNLLGLTGLEDLPRLAAEHHLTLCGNSAWLHISEAVGTPVLALAGPIVPGFGFSPWRPESRELGIPLACRPCTRHGGGSCLNPERHACMKRITPARLWEHFEGWWARYGGVA